MSVTVERVPLEEFVRAGQRLGLTATETLRAVRRAGIQVRTASWWQAWREELAEREQRESA